MSVSVTMNEQGYGAITIQGGPELKYVTSMEYALDGEPFFKVKATDAGVTAPDATDLTTTGQVVYTGDPIKDKTLLLKCAFTDGTEQIIYDKKF